MEVTLLSLCLLCLEIYGKGIFERNPPGSNSEIKSSCPEVFCVNSVFKKFAKSTGKPLCQCLFFKKVAGYSLGSV